MPTVSVIVPNYNHAQFLRQRIDSILAQTYRDFELILLDDCSADESREILSSYASDVCLARQVNVRLELNETNSGSPFKQWNKGVRLARGKYVWIAESDDYADPRFLERLVNVLDTDPEIAVAYCRCWGVSPRGTTYGFADGYVSFWDPEGWSADFCMDGRRMCQRYLCGSNRITNASGAVFRRDVYDRVGGADETLRLSGDWKLWTAMALQGKVAYLSEPLNYFRHHDVTQRTKIRLGDAAIEHLNTYIWIRDRIPQPEPHALRTAYLALGLLWVRAVLSPRIPRNKKREIMRLVRTIDPHPMRSAARFAPVWAKRLLAKQFERTWYGMLDLTYKFRHSVGLTRNGLAQIKVKFGR
jgi:glycosyltransferase involved in cell wall biosynthesis